MRMQGLKLRPTCICQVQALSSIPRMYPAGECVRRYDLMSKLTTVCGGRLVAAPLRNFLARRSLPGPRDRIVAASGESAFISSASGTKHCQARCFFRIRMNELQFSHCQSLEARRILCVTSAWWEVQSVPWVVAQPQRWQVPAATI